jgi:hypothetical protein
MGLYPLVGIQRAHHEPYIRGLGAAGLMASSTNTMMHGVRGFFRFAHIDGLIPADPPSTRARIRLDPTPRKLNRPRSSLAGLDLDAASTLHAVVMSVDTQITTEQVR